jgi:Fic family protein
MLNLLRELAYPVNAAYAAEQWHASRRQASRRLREGVEQDLLIVVGNKRRIYSPTLNFLAQWENML